ncbi:spore germination protein [Paenibacillus wynnii]|nr:spore germination protein [Paenibacillus wynnii]
MYGNYNIAGDDFVHQITTALGNPPDLTIQYFHLSSDLIGCCIFIKTITDLEKIENYIIRPLIEAPALKTEHPERIIQAVNYVFSAIPVIVIKKTDFSKCVQSILEGHVILFIPPNKEVLLIDVSKYLYREIAESKSEPTIRGPHDSFIESIESNISLVRKRLKTPHLRMEECTLGDSTQTKVITAYLQDVASPEVVNEFRNRIGSIKTDSILESAYIEEWIQDKTFTPFPTLYNTDRPDVVTAHLLEGRVVVFIDGAPNVLIGPCTFFQFFIAAEDYYQRADVASVLRWLRFFSFLLSILLPSTFVGIVSYHQELLPTPLLISFSAQREGVPFPAIVEALVMMVTLEILREAGLRMPRIAGQAISFVGAIVLGEAAVQAGLVSGSMVIVVAVTAISNFVTPAYSLGISQRLIQFALLFLAGFMGLYGVLCGVLFMLTHLVTLKSFGVPYFAPIAPTILADWKDTIIRVPRPSMKTLPKTMKPRRKDR